MAETLKLRNGQEVTLEFGYGGLKSLASRDKGTHQEFMNIESANKEPDGTEIATQTYVAYFCANYHDKDLISKEEFFDLLPFNGQMLVDIIQRLANEKN